MALSQEDLASLQQFTAEFHHLAGVNLVEADRWPEPSAAAGRSASSPCSALAPVAPVRFLEIAQAYQIMPDGFSAPLSVIIAFYFWLLQRQLKGQDMAVKGGALQMAREILAIRRAEQQLDQPAPGPESQRASRRAVQLSADVARAAARSPPRPWALLGLRVNLVVEEWRHRQAAGGRA